MKTVHVTATVHLVLKVDDNIEIGKVMEEIEVAQTPYNSKGCHDSFNIEDARFEDIKVTDSH